jgi:hypothetical protein
VGEAQVPAHSFKTGNPFSVAIELRSQLELNLSENNVRIAGQPSATMLAILTTFENRTLVTNSWNDFFAAVGQALLTG